MAKLDSIAQNALSFTEMLAKRPCKCVPGKFRCLACMANEILHPPETNIGAKDSYICPSCEEGHHERCSSAHCECECPV